MRTTHRTRQNLSTTTQSRTRKADTRRAATPRAPALIGPDGKRIRLSDLPLTAYWLKCGCTGRQFGIQDGDLLFCDKHADRYKVVRSQS